LLPKSNHLSIPQDVEVHDENSQNKFSVLIDSVHIRDTPQQRREDLEVQQEAAEQLVERGRIAAANAVVAGLPSVNIVQQNER
jgi:hypothetical protein